MIATFESDDALVRDLDNNQGPQLAKLTPHNRNAMGLIEQRIDQAERHWDLRRDWLNHVLGLSANGQTP